MRLAAQPAARPRRMRLSRKGVLALWTIGAAFAASALTSCAKDIDVQEPPGDRVEAMFDPSLRILPTPTNLAIDQQTGLLNVPVADKKKNPAQAEFDEYLNTLDGFPTSASLSVCFSGELESGTLDDALKVFALASDGKSAPTAVTGLKIGTPKKSLECPLQTDTKCNPKADKSGCSADQRCLAISTTEAVCADPGWKVTITRDEAWKRGATYAIYLTDAAKAKDGKSVIRSTLFEIAAGERPLCEWNDTTKMCTYSYSSLINAQVTKQVRAAAKAKAGADAGDGGTAVIDEEEVQKEIEKTILSSATQFEEIRRGTDKLLEAATAAKLERDAIVLAWAFSTVSMVEAEFDPTAGKLPGPGNDIIYDADKKKVNIPAPQNESAADKALRLGLNTLDGFSTTASYYSTFTGKLDSDTVKESGELLVLNATNPTAKPKVAFKFEDKAEALTITPTVPLEEANRYAVIMLSKTATKKFKDRFSGKQVDKLIAKADSGLADLKGRRVVASPIFALARLSSPLVKDGKSTVNVLDDASATKLEVLRKAYNELFNTLELLYQVKRRDVVQAWVFTTQTFTDTLTKLRGLPYSALGTVDKGKPKFTGTIDPSLTGFPSTESKSNIASWVQKGTFQTFIALDPKTGALLTDPKKGKPAAVPFLLTVPQGKDCTAATTTCPTGFTCKTNPTAGKRCQPDDGWPVVVFQHGVQQSKEESLKLADTFAKGGFALLAFDTIYHGARSICTSDAHCASGGTCDKATGKCSTSLVDKDGNGIVDASGAAFLNVANPFAIRDNIRQNVIDAASVLRALDLGAESGLSGGSTGQISVSLDEKNVHYMGHSLGAMLSTLVGAVEDKTIKSLVLSVPGAPLVPVFRESQRPQLKALLAATLKARKIERGSVEALQLWHTFQWILDPGDPANFAAYVKDKQLKDQVASAALKKDVKVPAKSTLFLLGGSDKTVPTKRQKALASWMKVDVSDTTYADGGHGFLFTPTSGKPGLMETARAQLINFLKTNKICKPDISKKTCK